MKRYAWVLATVMAVVLLTAAVTLAVPKKPQSKTTAVKKISTPAKSAKKNKPAAQAKLPKLVDLGAEKCVPCKMMVPVLDELKKEYKGKLDVVFIDVWKNGDAAEKYKIRAIPTQIFYDKSGKELARHEGYMPKEDIIKMFKEKGVSL
jgi:thioredoxin 1